jgi:glycine C-acetyltransferase/8-amino-7-oxononanoate synthase
VTAASSTPVDPVRDPLKGNLADFAAPRGRDLLTRTAAFSEWIEARKDAGLWPYVRSLEAMPSPETVALDEAGRRLQGTNFASQDYLGLGTHPAIHEAAVRALRDLGPHSAGSAILQGNTRLSRELEVSIGELLEVEHVLLFPTGWGAGYGSIVGLVRPYDYIVLDKLAHACLQQGAYAATRRVLRHEHLDVDEVRMHLETVRRDDPEAGILVVTEGLFSLDADVPEIARLQETCREFDATLLVDVAHDLGALGPGGTGQLGVQGMLAKVDLVMGSFSKTFASNGGFLASGSRSVTDTVRAFGSTATFSNALSPMQAAIVGRALEIVRSPEGDELRAALLRVAEATRESFSTTGIECLGIPSAIVIVPIGDESVARVATRALVERDVLVNVFEFPAVAVGAARFRLQVMATHDEQQVRDAAPVVVEAIQSARESVGHDVSQASA